MKPGELIQKIDAMSQRERIMVFAAALTVVIGIGYATLIDPQLAQRGSLIKQIGSQGQQLKTVQAELQSLAGGAQDPDAPNRARLESIKRQLAEIESFLHEKQEHLVPAEKVGALLEEVLRRNRGLQLVSLKTLAAAPLVEKTPAKADSAAPVGALAGVERQLYKHGVEITVKGSYLDLLEYLGQLEAIPWQVYWGRAELEVQEHPASALTLTVYTLSLEKAWLRI